MRGFAASPLTEESDMAERARPSRIARLGRYAARRIAGPLTGLPGHQALREACRGTGDAIRPKRFEQGDLVQGYRGRHADGGVARFRAAAAQAGLDEAALDRLAASRRRHARAACAAAAALLIAGVALPFLAQDRAAVLAGLGFGPLVLAVLATALRSDYAVWQIEQRRFGGFSEYAGLRWSGGGARALESPDGASEGDCGSTCESGGVPAQTEETESEAGESALSKDVARRRKRAASARERWLSDCDRVRENPSTPAICYGPSAPRSRESSQDDADEQGKAERRAARDRRDCGAESDQDLSEDDPEDRPEALRGAHPLIWMACAAVPLALAAAATPLLESGAVSAFLESGMGSGLLDSGVASAVSALESGAALAFVGGTAFCLAGSALLAMALRCDFIAWQIDERRFASPVEYVKVGWLGWRGGDARNSG